MFITQEKAPARVWRLLLIQLINFVWEVITQKQGEIRTLLHWVKVQKAKLLPDCISVSLYLFLQDLRRS